MEIIPDDDLLGFEPRLETVQFVKAYDTKYYREFLEVPADRIRETFRSIAQDVNRNMEISWFNKDWPEHRPTGDNIVMGSGYQTKDYEFLEDPEFDVDFIVMLVKSLEEVGPELGHILLRNREAYYHTFVVSLDSYPQSELSKHRKNLGMVPTISRKEDGSQILVPDHENTGHFDSISPIEQGLLSVQEFEDLSIDMIRNQLTYMAIRKLGKADIMNNKPRPETTNDDDSSMHDEGEDWKPDGWKPDNN